MKGKGEDLLNSQMVIAYIEMVAERVDKMLKNQSTLREETSQTNVILQYKLLAAILSAICSVIQQS